MRFRPLIFALFLPLLIAGSAYAQPSDLGYDPPPGWGYMMNFDHKEFKCFSTFDDSLYVEIKRTDSSITTYQHSTNGGKTWQPSTLPQNHKFVYGAIPVSGTPYILADCYDDSIKTLAVSTDLGQTWEDRARMNDFILNFTDPYLLASSFQSDKSYIKFDMHNPRKNWFVKYARSWSSIREKGAYEQMYFSADSGRTWNLLKIPTPSNSAYATSINFDIQFDYRDSAAWYFTSRGLYEPHIPPGDTATEYYVTRDQGKTFNKISIVGHLIGVTHVGEHFFWNGPDPYREKGYTTIDSNGTVHTVDLLQKITPGKFPLDTSSGYSSGIIPSFSFFYPLNPNQTLFSVAESKNDSKKDTIYYANSGLFFSKDSTNFQEIFHSSSRGLPQELFLDIAKGTIWLVTSDTSRTKYSIDPRLLRQSLWKRKIFALPNSSVDEGKEKDKANDFSPKLEFDRNQFSVTIPDGSKGEISITDILGRVLENRLSAKGERTFFQLNGLPKQILIIVKWQDQYRTFKVFQRE